MSQAQAATMAADAGYDEYSDAALKPVDGDSLSVLHLLAAEFLAAQKAVSDAEEAVKTAKATFEDIEQKRIPDWLEKLGLPEFRHKDPGSGATTHITCKDNTVANIEAAKREAAFAWFESIGKGGIISKVLEVDLGKADTETVGGLMDAVAIAAPTAERTLSRSIHASTLSATVRGLLAEGKYPVKEGAIADGLIKVTRLRKANVKIG